MNLDPDCVAYLAELEALNLPAGTVEEVRARYRALCARYAGKRTEVARVEELHAPIRARLYEDRAGAPVLVWFHGGRMVSGDLETHDQVCRMLASETGFRVLAADYRLAPEHLFPAAVEDALAAVTFAKTLSNRVAVGGDSAGGHLALWAATREHLEALVLVYPMLDATRSRPSHAEFAGGPATSSEDIRVGYEWWLPQGVDLLDERVSPLFTKELHAVRRAMVVTAGVDPLRDEGLEIARRLEMSGVPVTSLHYEDHLHGFLTYVARFAAAREVVTQIAGFLSL